MKRLPAAIVACLAFSLPLPSQQKGDPSKGKEVFVQCAACHAANGVEKRTGPGLKGLFKRAKLASGSAVTDQTVMGVVNKGGGQMPSFADVLTRAEKEDLLAYLKTL
jgi:mono/diheme cytochrome c family protein